MESKSRTGGFASMDQHKQREIARKGGMAAHRKGTAHEFTAEEARNAGRKGGQQVSANRTHMIEIGRLGGRRSAERRRTNLPVQRTTPDTANSEDTSKREISSPARDQQLENAGNPQN